MSQAAKRSLGTSITVRPVKKSTGNRLILVCELDITDGSIKSPEQIEITLHSHDSCETSLLTDYRIEERKP